MLIAILVAVTVLGVVWRLVRVALRIVLMIALIALIANYGSRLAQQRQHRRASPVPQQRR